MIKAHLKTSKWRWSSFGPRAPCRVGKSKALPTFLRAPFRVGTGLACAHPALIWTERMLTALGNEVRGGKWYSLFDKVCARHTLAVAWSKVEANQGAAGVDKISIERFKANGAGYLDELERALKEGTYEPLPVKRVYIPKGKNQLRSLGIPAVNE